MIHHIPGLDPVGLLEKYGRNFIRPHLRMEHRGERAIETVSVRYSVTEESMNFSGSTASGSLTQSSRQGRSRYVRLWVFNSWGFPAHHVEVNIEQIICNDRVVDLERSPLHWSDFEDSFEYPKIMRSGHRNGWYVDVCAADSIDSRFQILSLKGIKRGYHRYKEEGIYTIKLSAEALKPCKFGHLTLTVGYDAKNWKGLNVISAK